MRMLDAFHEAGRRRTSGAGGWFALGALAIVCLGAALPLAAASAQGGTALAQYQSTSGSREGAVLNLVEGTLARLQFSKPISTGQLSAKIANSEIATLDGGAGDELLLRGLKVGRTNLIVWFKDGGPETFDVVVKRDLSVLESALKAVHPSISVAAAADRNALILTGTVPDGPSATRAQQAAADYAQAMSADGKVINLIRVQAAVSALDQALTAQAGKMGAPGVTVSRVQKGAIADDGEDVFVLSGTVPDARILDDITDLVRAAIGDESGKKSRTVNQIVVTGQPSSIENVIERAIHEHFGHTNVKVSRIVGAEVIGDSDVLVMTGTVPNQTALIQTLTLAAKVFQQQVLVKRKRDGEFERVTETFAGGLTRTTDKPLNLDDVAKDIKVAADESGALHTQTGSTSSSASQGSGLRSILSSSGQGLGGSGTSGLGHLLENRVGSNIARAKAIELAEGRILSFIEVVDIPQVRVAIRLLEINRTDLLQWDSNIQQLQVADFDTASPNPDASGSGTDISNVVSFLEGGFRNRLQVGGEHLNVDAVLRLLETERIARTLANPTLTVLSGEIAAFSDGGRLPIQETTLAVGGEVAQNSTEFLVFGIQLAVRPLVDEHGYITLDVAPSVSNPDFLLTAAIRTASGSSQGTVALADKSLRTSARLRDGESLLIGGLQDRSRKDETDKTPGLASIPFLGWLFHDKSFEDKDRELMILINPSIVRDRPTQALLWAYPGSSEILGRLPKPAAKAGEQPAAAAQETGK